MPKFLLRSTYTIDGMKGLAADGGTRRAEVVQAMVENAGGHLESMHFAFGEDDTYVLCDMPDHPTAASVAIAIEAAGGLRVQVVPVLTPAEVDEATHLMTDYSPPGA
ncbi:MULTISPECIES: GYD domain-containing protein [unclassified Micromonospora]|uniref:GYD domain-containing protein n=1 Tax=unclassified Micromonospora TaxID=2617518 RepID=UPI001050C944|nr:MULTISPECIES: GYD domain-containing protein [unclassified Micromonospora]TDB81401.1 GYD domain-containing protein [Micromonospora sp. KC721]TDC43079.1 GYD domain-containing protein [Micromonospora sp. KC213]